MMRGMSAIHSVVRGRVQGVGFRYFTQGEAANLGLSGWVRNLPSGDVELVAGGPREDLETFIRHVAQGPPLSKVYGVETEWTEDELNGPFQIR